MKAINVVTCHGEVKVKKRPQTPHEMKSKFLFLPEPQKNNGKRSNLPWRTAKKQKRISHFYVRL